ncbi:hypothetical protein [Acinetobacter stercoris]|uniref:Uncharacterized protein n=1 Tax=Acinetobacter stercoris TaxID=2126983 RepID=A0A2U3N068_9GAMM|nr:hypothetical protein [Acinetobacter stercoris]SPL71080.1 hypothetical protein KPC_2258 [Acinetobacter stercoris]
MLPNTIDEAIQAIGKNCTKQKIADLIISGELEACFYFEGVIGVVKEFIPIVHSTMTPTELKTELLHTQINPDWLKIPKDMTGLYDFLYQKQEILKIKSVTGKCPTLDESRTFDFVLLDEIIEYYELSQEISDPKILSYSLTLDELHISAESLKKYIEHQQTEDINIALLNEIETLKKQIATLNADLVKGKSKKTYNQLIYALLNYAKLDISHPYSIYHLLAKHCDEQKEVIPIPTNEVFADYVQKAVYEFNNRDPK